MSGAVTFHTLNEVAAHLRERLENKDHLLLFGHNGTGKTRLSTMFREIVPNESERDTLYFNAFTEDLFTWDNDQRVLRINSGSTFVTGLREQEMESRIREFLPRYADFYFFIDYDNWAVRFGRGGSEDGTEPIKVSRGEERLFIWCFFLAVAKLALDGEDSYSWVKYLYIDDPISSLDDNNAIAVAVGLVQMLKESDSSVKTIISSHHALFFNVMANELRNEFRNKTENYFMSKQRNRSGYTLKSTGNTPSFHHVALLWQLQQAAQSGEIYTYHFNMLRSVLEKTAAFHGYGRFSECIRKDEANVEDVVHARMVNLLSHGNYSLFDPIDMVEDNKRHFRDVLDNLVTDFRFNPEILGAQSAAAPSP